MTDGTCFHHECNNSDACGGLSLLHGGVSVGFICKTCLLGSRALDIHVSRADNEQPFIVQQVTVIDRPNQV